MPRHRTEPTPLRRYCRTCGLLKDSQDDFYPRANGSARPDCKPCDLAAKEARRQAALETEQGRERQRERWRRDKAKYRARMRLDPAVRHALDAAALRGKEDAKNRRAAFARFRLADAQREERLRREQGAAYVPPGMRAPWARNSKRRRDLGKTPEQLRADARRRMDEEQLGERWEPRDFSDIEAVRARHREELVNNQCPKGPIHFVDERTEERGR